MTRFFAALLTLLVAVLLLAVAWPQLFGLERVFGFAHAVSFRGSLVVLAVVLVVLFGIMAARSRRMRGFAGAMALLLVLFAGINAAVLATRGTNDDALPAATQGDLVVMVWNTMGSKPGAAGIAKLALAEKADIVVLPETFQQDAQDAADIMTGHGRPMQELSLSYDHVSPAKTTSVLISTDLGEYKLRSDGHTTATLPSVVAVPVDGTGPTIVGAHPVSPVVDEFGNWQSGLDWLSKACVGDNIIMAGDFNSTLDHYTGLGHDATTTSPATALGDCVDGAHVMNAAALGTWPVVLPPLMSTPIDHVTATDDWQFVGYQVIESQDASGSDHRPVVALLRPNR